MSTPVPPADIARAAGILLRGGLVAFPTETVYGLGADAASETAVARIFAAKGRPADHPLIVHVAAAADVARWARDIPPVAWELAARFWPGPLTLILRRAPGVHDAVTGGQDTVGLRVPAHPVARELLRAFGGGIAAPSANRFGRVSATTAAHVVAEFGATVDCVLDAGACALGLESTILDLSGSHPRVLRPGGVSRDELGNVLGVAPGFAGEAGPRVPGRLAAHYVPDTPLRLVSDARAIARQYPVPGGLPAAVLSLHQPVMALAGCRWVTMPADPVSYGQQLYARLREVDTWGCGVLLVERPPEGRAWEAVHDRLARAAGSAGRGEGAGP
ncbi:MAG: L-threonylcarbamoyladenylate synthase [Gammaproteobacteria bacterium]|nr:L-threonylcarbamoyladenylate synthase [Gammaproteobacteria bacterium]